MNVDQFLHEQRGLCWHEGKDVISRGPSPRDNILRCSKCHEGYNQYDAESRPSYSTSAEAYYRELIPWAMQQEWWNDFVYGYLPSKMHNALSVMLSPERGAPLIAEFLGYQDPNLIDIEEAVRDYREKNWVQE